MSIDKDQVMHFCKGTAVTFAGVTAFRYLRNGRMDLPTLATSLVVSGLIQAFNVNLNNYRV